MRREDTGINCLPLTTLIELINLKSDTGLTQSVSIIKRRGKGDTESLVASCWATNVNSERDGYTIGSR